MRRALASFCLLALFAATAAAESVRFSVTADNRDCPGFSAILEQIRKLPGGAGAFMVLPGDIDPPADTRAQLDKVLGKDFPWYPVVGNHEASTKEDMTYLRAYYHKALKGKVRPGPQGTTETTYSFDAGPVHIAVINQYWNGRTEAGSDARAKGNVVAALREWLKADLAASTKPWKLVVGHEPAFPQPDLDLDTQRHTGSSLNAYKGDRDAFWNLLREQQVAAYLCGHTHRYSRFLPRGSKVWQIDAGQARGDAKSWKYDAFVIVTADEKKLKFEAYRNLKERGRFTVSDTLELDR